MTAQVLAAISSGERGLREAVREHGGLYHLAARGDVTRFEQARAVQRHAHRLRPGEGFDACRLRPIPASEYPCEARRPRCTPLSSVLLESTFGFSLPGWEEDLVRCLEDRLLPE